MRIVTHDDTLDTTTYAIGVRKSPYRLTVQDIIDSMTEEQKTVMYAVVGQWSIGLRETHIF